MNVIEEAQVRVAKAQDERDRLHERVRDEYGALHEVDTYAKGGDARARTLRSLYDKAVRELRLAKQDLEFERIDARQAEERPSPAPNEAEVELTATEDGIALSLPPELQDLQGRSGTGTVTEILPNGDAVVEIDLGPEGVSEYDRLLQQYKRTCDRIHELPDTFGGPPSWEEKELKKSRLHFRKSLKALAPLKTCWFCSGFSINNYDNPCRNGKLDSGAVPTDACHVWKIARGEGYLTEECTVAMQEMRDEIAAREAAEAPAGVLIGLDGQPVVVTPLDMAPFDEDCDGCIHIESEDRDVCHSCEENGDEAGNPTHYEAAPSNGPDVVITVNDAPAEGKEDLMQHIADKIAEGEAANAARRQQQLDLDGNPVRLPDGVIEDIKVSRKRVYRDGFYTLSINEKDLLRFIGLSYEDRVRLVTDKMRIKPGPDDDFEPDEIPEQIERMAEILAKASIMLAAATRGEA